MRKLLTAAIVSCSFSTCAFAASCDDNAIAAQITGKYQPALQKVSGSACETAKVMQAMLAETKKRMGPCLASSLRAKTFAQLDETIRQWRQTQTDACQ